MRYVKNLPAQDGTLTKHETQPIINYNKASTYGLYSTPVISNAIPTKPTHTTALTPSLHLGYDHYPSSTPQVFIRPHSQSIDDYSSYRTSPTTTPPITSTSVLSSIQTPSTDFEPPYKDKYSPIAIYTTTPSPIAAIHTPSTNNYETGFTSTISSTTSKPRPLIQSSTPKPIIPLNNNYVDGYSSHSKPSTSSASNTLPHQQYNYPDGEGLQYNNHLGSGYEPQYTYYDGVSATNNGFKYYLPRQYHEESNHDLNKKTGSFGYIDPFGIRRVIYYNASPEHGFIHRKNNRYVGFNATPYDPRPKL